MLKFQLLTPKFLLSSGMPNYSPEIAMKGELAGKRLYESPILFDWIDKKPANINLTAATKYTEKENDAFELFQDRVLKRCHSLS